MTVDSMSQQVLYGSQAEDPRLVLVTFELGQSSVGPP